MTEGRENPEQTERLTAERAKIRESIETELAALSPEQNERQEFLTREPAFYSFGGTRFEERRRTEGFTWTRLGPDIETLQDVYGLQPGKPAFGVGENWNRRYLIYRELQQPDRRGGYPYTVIFDPGEEVWRLYGNNGALLTRNIQRDPELYDMLTQRPEEMTDSYLLELIERLVHADRTVEAVPDPELEEAIRNANESEGVQHIPAREKSERTIEGVAAAIAAMPEDVRESATWLINGGGLHGRELGAKLVWDRER